MNDVHIVSVETPFPPASCVLIEGLGDSLSDIVLLKNQFDLNRIKKEFEEEELNAYNKKVHLSYLERKQSAAAAIHRQAKMRERPNIEEIKEKMEKLVHTLETDVSGCYVTNSIQLIPLTIYRYKIPTCRGRVTSR